MAPAAEAKTDGLMAGLWQSLPYPLVATDLEGRVTAATKAAEKQLGLPFIEGMLYHDLPLAPEQKRPEMANPRQLERAEEEIWPVTDERGQVTGAVQMLSDTALAGEKLCAAMAHELRNPLTGIRGFASILDKDLQESDNRRELVRKIITGVNTVNDTVSSMLDFCRSKSMNSHTANLRELVAAALVCISCTPEIDVRFDICEHEQIRCDKLQMQQVFINLFKNAIEAMGAAGTLTVRADRGNGSLTISITDTGCGMDAETRAGIFRPFFSTKPQGTGIGMAVVQKIVHQHGGEINLQSQPGEGTTVTLTLPHC